MTKAAKTEKTAGEKTYIIEKGIPIPTATRRGRESRFPLRKMEVGDSFPLADSEIASVRALAFNISKKEPEKKFVTRRAEDGTFRVWRKE